MRLDPPNRKGTPVRGDCCPSAFGYLTDKALMIYGRHDRETHLLPLTPEDLRNLANLIERGRDILPPSEQAA